MTKRIFLTVALLLFVFSFTLAFATQDTPEARGKTHFENAAFAEGKKPCSTCHPNGSGLAGAGAKTVFHIMGGKQTSLEDVINVCIVNANKGNAIDGNSVEMQELVSYIKSLGQQTGPGSGK